MKIIKCIKCNTEIKNAHGLRKYCKQCLIIMNKVWKRKEYQNNKEKYIQRAKKWWKQNLEKARKIRNKAYKKYYKVNKHELDKKNIEYRNKNTDKVKHWKKRDYKRNVQVYKNRSKDYKAKKRIATPHKAEKLNYQAIYEMTPYCFYCNRPLKLKEVHFDHFIPLSKGGLHIKQNIKVSCAHCNISKHNKMPEDFIKLKEATNGIKL